MMFGFKENFIARCLLYFFAGIHVSKGCFPEHSKMEHKISSNTSFYQECQCSIPGGSLESLKWINPSGQVIPSLGPGTNINAYSIQLQRSVSLHVKSFTSDMSGEYKCIAVHNGKEYIYTHIIEAYDPLNFINPELNQFITYGEDSKIKCRPHGAAPHIVKWYKNEELLEIRNSDKYEYQFDGDGLIVKNVNDDDGGDYKCLAAVPETAEQLDITIKVKVFSKPEIEDMIITSGNPIIIGEFLKIECKVKGIPKPNITWSKLREKDAKLDNNSWVEEGNVILFEQVAANDQGIYRCSAVNEAGSTKSDVNIEVFIPPLIEEFRDATVVEGTNTSLICKASGRPAPQLTIMKRIDDVDTPLQVTKSLSWIFEQHTETISALTVIFSPVLKSHDGQYICAAKNRVEEMLENANLTVFFIPTFEKTEEIVYGWNGKTVTLNCEHTSNPESTVLWRYNKSEILEDSPDITLYDSYPQHYLTVSFENNTYFGIYKCFARNKIGESVKTIKLLEAFPPSEIYNVTVINIAATSTTFEISDPEIPMSLPIIGYTAEYDEAETYNYTDIHQNRTWSVYRPYKVEKLRPGTVYLFRFAAINEVGVGSWSDTIEVTTPKKSIPEAPRFSEDVIIKDADNSVIINWETLEFNGDPIDYYLLRYCPVQNNSVIEEECKEDRLLSVNTNSTEIINLLPNTTYFITIMAHNSEGYSDEAKIFFQTPTEEINLPKLSAGVIIGLTAFIAILILVILDLILLYWRKQGVIHALYNSKKKNNKLDLQGERDKKGLLKEGENNSGDTLKKDKNDHKEYEYNKTTGIITGKHSAV